MVCLKFVIAGNLRKIKFERAIFNCNQFSRLGLHALSDMHTERSDFVSFDRPEYFSLHCSFLGKTLCISCGTYQSQSVAFTSLIYMI